MRERERVTSRKNPLIGRLRTLAGNAGARREEGAFILDGITLLEETLRYGGWIELVVAAEGFPLPQLPEEIRVVEVPEDLLAFVAPTKSPQGVLTVCKLPDLTLPERLDGSRYVILDTIQDPGNVGAILRSCNAFGVNGLILSGACADPFGPKAVRGSMGAVFRTPIYAGSDEAICAALGELPCYRADLTADAQPLGSVKLNPGVIVIGSEGRGISPFWRAQTSAIVIPMAPTCESLNAAVAAGIILYEMSRQDGNMHEMK